MQTPFQPLFIGETPLKQTEKTIQGEYVPFLGELYYKIHNFDGMEPFFISIVSSSDHWLFISSTGGLSAGRGSAEQSIFPYYTVDKLTENSENTGSKTILLAGRGGRMSLWEPFSERQSGIYTLERSLYKNVSGTALVFEEKNLDLGLTFRYAWRTGEKFGFVRTAWLLNTAGSTCQVELLDGIQNILPANISSQTQITFSSLLDAYKRSELDPATGLATFALNSRLTDLAEPSESLQATTVAQIGLDPVGYLLSSLQLDRFRSGKGVQTETEVRGQRGAYFVQACLELSPNQERSWHLVADAQQDSAAVVLRLSELQGDRSALLHDLESDIAAGQASLWKIVASADGLQLSNNPLCTAHHFANVMFNGMRGGVFVDQYWIQARDFLDFVALRNREVLRANPDFFSALPERIHLSDLLARAEASGTPDLVRLSYACLPLAFSRRHGDPSRPWNRFAINLKKPDGSLKLDYEGNWRDIFQNWEALAYSYPEFVEGMLSTFLNATTADGYNPYRITYRGLDWEVPEPGNPWANIGYWSDHQIIYLQKLMEISVKMHPGRLQDFLARPLFSYAQVPYYLKPYADLLKDPTNSIDFNWDLERQIEARRKELGTDGNLVLTPAGQVLQVSLAEKLLTLLLAKLANFVPEGGIWMNTQRPEWNDANNALVGKGLSVVTLCYLRRYIAFCRDLFAGSPLADVPLNSEVRQFYTQVAGILAKFQPALRGSFDDMQRKQVMDALGQAGSDYRWNFYQQGFAGQLSRVPLADLVAFLDLAQEYVEHSLRANRREDALYHSYNILHLAPGRAAVGHLYEMLEGQVAVLSSGLLGGAEALALLHGLRQSALYQASQNTYILYPDRDPRGFLEKNCLTPAQVEGVRLFAKLIENQDRTLITQDIGGITHFSGPIRNFRDVSRALDALKTQAQYAALVEAEYEKIQALFEETFHHNEFTGRSGTFFAYEGLGSVYWHMVSKLLLAVQEVALLQRGEPSGPGLRACYADVRQGLSFNKTPQAYGAFPTDPYSHTPKGQGAKQPGMTGMVKEEILARLAELGLSVEGGRLVFDMRLLDLQELLSAPAVFPYLDVQSREQALDLQAGSLAYTFCQTPVVLTAGSENCITVHYTDGTLQRLDGHVLDEADSRRIFLRDGSVHHLLVSFARS